ncbi:hypothetical protein R1sor_026675 [Riccia sorocarpa]|uniref:Uncharacterized protein n=1 Tax=Riccia sorocarpa TaxID=122646 RepID=A0ABD3GC15_9MARC
MIGQYRSDGRVELRSRWEHAAGYESVLPNPYSGIGLDKLAQAHRELDAQRARFAAEKRMPVSAVRFASGSGRGWILLPRSAISSSSQGAHYDSAGPPSNVSNVSSSPERRGTVRTRAQ